MPGKVAKIGSFSDWVGLFNEWRKEVGVNKGDVEAFHFDTLYGAIETEDCLLYTSPSPRDRTRSRMPSSA